MSRAADDGFADCVQVQYPRLMRLAYLLTSNQDDAKDLLQESVAKAYRHRRRIDPDLYVAYLRRTVLNTYLSTSARAVRLRRHLPLLISEAETAPETVQVETRLTLWPLIDKLPPRQRAVVVLRYDEGCSEQEIARILGCSPGSVNTHASRALTALRTQLTPDSTPVGEGGSR